MGFFDSWLYVQKARLAVGAFVLFCVSTCSTFRETEYAINGKETLAMVTKAQMNDGRRRSSWSVTYEFDDNGQKRTEEDYGSSLDRNVDVGQTVPVEYVPGKIGTSRVAGTQSKLMMIPFFAAVVIGAVGGWGFMKEYREVEKKRSE